MTKHAQAIRVSVCTRCGAHCMSGTPIGNFVEGHADQSSAGHVLCADCRELFIMAGLVPFLSDDLRPAHRLAIVEREQLLAARRLLNGWGVPRRSDVDAAERGA